MGGLPGRPNPLSWVGAKVQEVRLRKERHAGLLWGRLTWGPGRAGAGKQLYGPVHSSSVACGHRLGQRLHPHNPGYPVSWH